MHTNRLQKIFRRSKDFINRTEHLEVISDFGSDSETKNTLTHTYNLTTWIFVGCFGGEALAKHCFEYKQRIQQINTRTRRIVFAALQLLEAEQVLYLFLLFAFRFV